jgi:myo-inositol-1(or 4)-monophosphatase
MAGQQETTDLLAVGVAVVRSGGPPRAAACAPAESTAVATKTTDTDVVTAADRAVERQDGGRAGPPPAGRRRARGGVRRRPARAPEAGRAGTVRWVLDPIDGTVNYLYGLPWYAVSLAAEVDGEVVAGVVRNAATGEEWTAAAGRGAWRAGRRLHGSSRTGWPGAGRHGVRVRPRPPGTPGRGAWPACSDRVRDIRRLGAASIDLCLAAEGAVDAYFEKGLQPWDLAAGGLIAAEAGLRVAGIDGAPPARPGHRGASGAVRAAARPAASWTPPVARERRPFSRRQVPGGRRRVAGGAIAWAPRWGWPAAGTGYRAPRPPRRRRGRCRTPSWPR